jgi:hypothetical protein
MQALERSRTQSGRDSLDGLRQSGNFDAEFVYSQVVQNAFAVWPLGKLLLDLQAVAHAVLNLGAGAHNLSGDGPYSLCKGARVSALPNTADRQTPGARRLTYLADGLIEDEATNDPASNAVNADVNGFGE